MAITTEKLEGDYRIGVLRRMAKQLWQSGDS
jgi:hypothetical protein